MIMKYLQVPRKSGGNDDEFECKSKCMRPLEASYASNCAGTVDYFSLRWAQLYILKPSFDCADQQDTHVHIRTHRQTNRRYMQIVGTVILQVDVAHYMLYIQCILHAMQ